jgi:hypothetical protein
VCEMLTCSSWRVCTYDEDTMYVPGAGARAYTSLSRPLSTNDFSKTRPGDDRVYRVKIFHFHKRTRNRYTFTYVYERHYNTRRPQIR